MTPPKKKNVMFVAPKPPPHHGGAKAMELILESPVAREFGLYHVDSRFTPVLSELQKFTLKKLFLIPVYCWQMMWACLRRRMHGVVLTPTMFPKPFLKDAVLIWWSTFILRRKTAGWFHTDWRLMEYETRGRFSRWLIRKTLLRLDAFIMVSDSMMNIFPDFIPQDRKASIPNGINLPPIPPRPSHEGRRLRVLYLSNLVTHKGWLDFLEAARILCRERQDVEFLIHGVPTDVTDEQVKEIVAKDDAGGRIRYGGPVYGDEKWKTFADADVFCLPSHSEAFPLAVLEAMAASLPVVATNAGALVDAIVDGSGGWIVPIKDMTALLSKLNHVLDHPDARKQFGEFNRKRFEEQFTTEAFGRHWVEYLHGWLK